MKRKRLISLTICFVLSAVPGFSVISFAGNERETIAEAEQHFETANELRKAAAYDAAIAEYKIVISMSPNSKIAHNAQYWIGQTYFVASQFEPALSAFQKLLDEYPRSEIIPSAKDMIERIEQAKKNREQAQKNRSLFKATEVGDIKLAEILIARGADVNTKDWKGRTPLQMAVQNGKIEVANLLIAHGANVNAKNGGGLLCIAALKGDIKMANLLILKGADVNAKNKNGLTPVSRALLSDGGGRLMIDLLVSKGAKVPELHLAAHRGDIDKVRSSLEKGTKIDVRDKAMHTPLFYAASAGQINVVDLLISKGADVNAKDIRGGETPLFYAAKAGQKNVVELLIDKGADVNARGSQHSGALESAAWLGRSDVAELLIAKGADVNAKDDWDYIPLHAAAGSGLVEIVKLLIAKGSDVNAKNEWGETPLHSAILYGQIRVVEVLIAKSADVNAKTNHGQTPLQSAQKNGHTDIVELLRKHGAKE
jgi:ankyrin repeat protein